ncbi:uncharacterized protein PGTG_16886 [Puccinia graminis f. sp. tritici CRL 75-36-700-3]|uniref:Uncharacterized protein n=1 Tax=Puccinia graminis f. sp. tritici (strain CRL 75-36-700-3 / race SCCL) TaxID=418459 RepID=E3L3L6_PUCGT|nr:uncharacterized protein PGTG_16886 [Puccinia graminis f. sp. tritici CRL 75-36-700-3]EFP91141.1 hypothetical protein PGTG_16886 [Puccinia graminis f. sp. tritici CRL 75-36-700-3]
MSRYGLYYLISSVLSYLSYSFLSATGSPQRTGGGATQTPDDLSTGIHQYIVDYCYISVFVWLTTGLISKSFWMAYWILLVSLGDCFSHNSSRASHMDHGLTPTDRREFQLQIYEGKAKGRVDIITQFRLWLVYPHLMPRK